MEIVIAVEYSRIRSGIEARSDLLRICGHGKSAEEATESLAKAVRAWCIGLSRAGLLERVAEQKGVQLRESPDDLRDPRWDRERARGAPKETRHG